MENFTLARPRSLDESFAAMRAPGAMYIAGGTDMMQLLRDNIIAPPGLVDLENLRMTEISSTPDELRLGALATMADVAANPAVRSGWKAISEALLSAASPQIRNMGTVGGNLLQRTRCPYFRDTGSACNKRVPDSGCPAIEGDNRDLSIFGGSPSCIASHPSDMPVALVAMGARIVLRGPGQQERVIPLRELYRLPGDTPWVETNLRPREIIVAVLVPASPAARASTYVKLRDRASFAFALTSAAVGLHIEGGIVRDACVALGGVAPMPWRAEAVEHALRGRPATEASFAEAAARAADGATPVAGNRFKVDLAARTVARALQIAAA